MKINKSIFTISLCLTASMVASKSIADEHRQHAPHVHGVGQLQVAVDGTALSIDMESPAINVVGFEHPPGNTEEKERVHTAADLLRQGGSLFAPTPDADCRLTESSADSELLADQHDHEGEHHHEGEEHHSAFHAHYLFHCKNPQALTYTDVYLFRHFPAMETLEAQFVTDRGQGAAKLTPGAFRLMF
ncbi:MAG: DUF2796 domain-containing protein [Magnetococcus sp. THC-1_WYH]